MDALLEVVLTSDLRGSSFVLDISTSGCAMVCGLDELLELGGGDTGTDEAR